MDRSISARGVGSHQSSPPRSVTQRRHLRSRPLGNRWLQANGSNSGSCPKSQHRSSEGRLRGFLYSSCLHSAVQRTRKRTRQHATAIPWWWYGGTPRDMHTPVKRLKTSYVLSISITLPRAKPGAPSNATAPTSIPTRQCLSLFIRPSQRHRPNPLLYQPNAAISPLFS